MVKTLEVSERVSQQARLQKVTWNHNRVASMLRESEKWLRIAEVRDPTVERMKVLDRLVAMKGELKSEQRKLRELIGPSDPHYMPKIDSPSDRRSEKFGRFVAVLEKVQEIQRGPESRGTVQRRIGEPGVIIPPWQVPPSCEPQSRLLVSHEKHPIELSAPDLMDTLSSHEFTGLETGDYFGVSFKDMYVEISDEDIFIHDGFNCAVVMRFTTFEAPCSGIVRFDFRNELVYTPKFEEPDFGLIEVIYRQSAHHGEKNFPDSDYSYIDNFSTATPIPDYCYEEVGSEEVPTLYVSEGQKGYLDISVQVSMRVAGGRVAFASEESDDIDAGRCLFRKLPGAAGPGVIFTFEPSG